MTLTGVSNVNFVTQSKESELQRMWDLETLGIKGGDDVHEELIGKIKFNGIKYSVKLPWKQGHERIPAYYANSLSWLKGQVKKPSKEPNVLKEYDKVIGEQLNSAVIEEVAVLERKECVHYLLIKLLFVEMRKLRS